MAATNVLALLYPAFVLLLLLFTPVVCVGQTASGQPIVPDQDVLDARYQELVAWLEEYEAWEAWVLRWGNKVAYNSAGGIIKKRPLRPEPPDWLWEDCRTLLVTDGKLGTACEILDRWDNLTQLIISRRNIGGFISQTDIQPKSSFLQRVHLTAGWVPAQLPAPKVYLVAGMQVGIVEVGRATLPAIGVGLMAIADGEGGYEWKPATVLGIGYRLKKFPFPWIDREASLHINVARATVHGVSNVPLGFDPSQNLIGFSLTFAKR